MQPRRGLLALEAHVLQDAINAPAGRDEWERNVTQGSLAGPDGRGGLREDLHIHHDEVEGLVRRIAPDHCAESAGQRLGPLDSEPQRRARTAERVLANSGHGVSGDERLYRTELRELRRDAGAVFHASKTDEQVGGN